MSLTGNNILGGASGQTTGYDIDQSLRFGDGYLRKSFSTGTNPDKLTISCWVKPANLGATATTLFYGQSDANNFEKVVWNASGYLYWTGKVSGSTSFDCYTSMVFRDPASWYHLTLVYDSAQSTGSDRVNFYVNGVLQTKSTDTAPAQNLNSFLLSSSCTVGENESETNLFKSYMAECHAIDGQALTPASFGETNSATNQWQAIKYAGSYGTNGFYLKFQDSSALGDDSSGNTNDFSATNLVATDQVLDSPTLNYCTLNPVDGFNSMTATEGNLRANTNSGNNPKINATFQIPQSGKWYWEFVDQHGLSIMVGVVDQTNSGNIYGNNNSVIYSSGLGTKYNFSSVASYGASWTTGDIIGVAINRDDNEITFYKNNSSQGTFTIGGTAAQRARLIPVIGTGTTGTGGGTFNFGQDSSFHGTKTAQGNGGDGEDFYYTPPTGYKALNSFNLDDPAIALPTAHFNTVLWSGSSSAQAITGVGFEPTAVWTKRRNATGSHYLWDQVRGNAERLETNSNGAEETQSGQWTSFDSDGFTLPGGSDATNNSGGTYVAWNWKAGGTAVSNSNGTITSSVSANPTAGFSIISFTGDGNAGATVGHGLSQAPEMWITKSRSATGFWYVGNVNYSSPAGNYYQHLELTAAQASNTGVWNGTLPSSTVITLGNLSSYQNVSSTTYISYAFHSVEGYSKVGTYEGNANADGPFVYTGFKPAFVIIKGADQAGSSWFLMDNKRDEYNVVDKELFADSNSAEGSGSRFVDFNSNGFKLRANDALNYASTMIYYVVAESPFKFSNAR
jgi:hypothetical protein